MYSWRVACRLATGGYLAASLAVNETPVVAVAAALETKLMERLQLNSERNDDTSARTEWVGLGERYGASIPTGAA